MQFEHNTILVTGGGSGIGLALAERLHRAGNTLIICGRRGDKLAEAQAKNPKFHTRVCDLSSEQDRVSLAKWATHEFPELNVIINNAGIQKRIDFVAERDWKCVREEMITNLEAPVHLCQLFIPHFNKKPKAMIVNVTSGLSFSPLANVPVYCATKAALHSFTLSLRHQLLRTSIKVVEIIPPAVNTDLGGPGLHTFGVPLQEFADSVVERLCRGDIDIPFGTAQYVSRASRDELEAVFQKMNEPQKN